MAISTLLFPGQAAPHPFKNCVVLGFITDEKGQKLSKSKKNYTDPIPLMDAHGGDAVRWSLYTGTVAGQGTRYSDAAVIDALREFVLKLWNVYSFFVTYANIDGWQPPAALSPVQSRAELDRYILAELDDTVRSVALHLDAYDSNRAARAIEAFAETLSNWYVRRSRARFWAQADSADKQSAFETLWEVLVEFSKLIAPFVPFVSEALYQNLVRAQDPSAPASVHLAEFPREREARKNPELLSAMQATREAVTLGQRVRAERKLKVRQPLSEAIVAVASAEERARIERFAEAVREELNVHTVTFTEEPQKFVTFELLPNFRALGPKLGKDLPLLKQALSKASGSDLYAQLEATGSIEVGLPSGPVKLGAEDIQVRLAAKSDYAAAASRGHVVVLDTRVSPELRREGFAREVINRVQRARKTLDLPYEARIHVHYTAADELALAISEHAELIASETLAQSLEVLAGDGAAATANGLGDRQEVDVDGEALTFWIRPSV
jgi:isoleucyl-tRNA synthetase